MEKRYSIALSVAVVALLVGLVWTYYGATPLDNNGGLPDNMIRLSIPQSNKIVASPLHIEGEARGTWYFEASFPIHIEDANGTILGQHY
ncbi:MAG: Gmad2 immunoglobulin-like domain-containing protein, partial [bacterium]|nr:Gmad2 immunoglobulin-like domain-containing protein [bacterium]